MRKILFTLMIIALLGCPAMAQRYRQQQLFIVDEFGQAVTDITSISVYDAGTTTATTLYADRAGKIAMTNPITTSSTASKFSQSLGLVSWFQLAPDYKVTITDGTKTLTVDELNEIRQRFPWFENYIGTAASLSVADNQSITVGTDSDGVLSWVNGTSILHWVPDSDGVSFDIGSTLVAKQFDFHVYVGGIGGGGLTINEGTSVLTWLAGDFVVNDSGSGDFLINAGAATGAITLGSGTSGAWAIDGTAGGTLNADDSIDITTSAAGANITLDAVLGSILIDSGENAASAISLITNTGTSETIVVTNTQGTGTDAITLVASAGGFDIDAADDISIKVNATGAGEDLILHASGAQDTSITLISAGTAANAIDIDTSAGGIDIDMAGGAAGEDFSITTATSITLTTSEAVADQFKLDATGAVAGNAINLETTSGGIIMTADHATNGDITLDAEDDIILTATGGVTITNTSPVTISGAFEPDIVIVPDGAAYDVLANNSGQIHIIPGQTADITLDLPAEADGLHYRFVYVGGAEDVQDWIIDSESNTNFFYGGLMTIDDDDHSTLPVYSDETDDSILTILTPGAGTVVEMWCDGTNWYVTGTVVSGTDTAVTFTNL